MLESESSKEICSHCGQPTAIHTPDSCSLAAEKAEYQEKLQETKDAEGITAEFEEAVKKGEVTYAKQMEEVDAKLAKLFSEIEKGPYKSKQAEISDVGYREETDDTLEHIGEILRKSANLIDDRPKKDQYNKEWNALMDRSQAFAVKMIEGEGEGANYSQPDGSLVNESTSLIGDIGDFINRLENEEYTPVQELYAHLKEDRGKCDIIIDEIHALQKRTDNIDQGLLDEYYSLSEQYINLCRNAGDKIDDYDFMAVSSDKFKELARQLEQHKQQYN